MHADTLHDPIRLLLHGAGGRMGRAVLDQLPRFAGLRLEAVISRSRPPVPADVAVLSADALGAAPPFDVAIDFSLHAAFDPLLAECVRRGAALVSGTTGLSLAQRQAMQDAACRIPLLWASNFSPGMAVLGRLVERAAAALPDWDCEILDVHHRHKRDAPSGTAITLCEAVERGRDEALRQVSRYGHDAARRDGEIGVAVLRGGDVVGDHTVSLFGPHERIELSHRAHDRGVFAYGALMAAEALPGRPAGMHQLADLLMAGP